MRWTCVVNIFQEKKSENILMVFFLTNLDVLSRNSSQDVVFLYLEMISAWRVCRHLRQPQICQLWR